MSDNFNRRANALAEEYWRLKERMARRDYERELREIERLLERGVGGRLREELERRAKEMRMELESKEGAFSAIKDVTHDLLELTARFAPNLDLWNGELYPYDDEPLSERYLTAITDILFGKPEPEIRFKNAVISERGIEIRADDEISAVKTLSYITTIIQEAAKKKLGLENELDSSWERLIENDYAFVAFKTLVGSGKPMSLDEIKEVAYKKDREFKELVKDVYDKRLAEELERLASVPEYNVVERSGGAYEVTDFGRWVWALCQGEARRGGKPAALTGLKEIMRRLRRG
ncbi:MAG: hypothetical protein ACXQTZ_00135 [Candidatus Alkanophagales archaeon]